MSTLVGSMNARATGPNSRPSHPVDAALWGLAERLAGSSEPTRTEVVDVSAVDPSEPADHRTSQVRVVRLPQRAGALPSVGRMGQRNRAAVAPSVGVPTKPMGTDSIRTAKPAALPGKAPRRKEAQSQETPPRVRRAQFTILKSRNSSEGRQGASGSVDPKRLQESTPNSEMISGDPPKARRRTRGKRRTGVTIMGWLALTAVAVAAAAIALFAPSWF